MASGHVAVTAGRGIGLPVHRPCITVASCNRGDVIGNRGYRYHHACRVGTAATVGNGNSIGTA